MSRFGTFAGHAAATRTPDSGVPRVAANVSAIMLPALATLVDRLGVLAATPAPPYADAATLAANEAAFVEVRTALRQLTARSREGALVCRMLDGDMLLDGEPTPLSFRDVRLERLRQRIIAMDIGTITVREGAAPGELLTLARLLVEQREAVADARLATQPVIGDTPTHVGAVGDESSSHDLLRSWSVLVTRLQPTVVEAIPTTSSAGLLAHLTAARSDDAMTRALRDLQELLDDAQRRGDGGIVEVVAHRLIAQLRVIGSGAGRVAIEGALRLMLRPAVLDLLTRQLPHSTDRGALLQVIARAGDAGVETMIGQLLIASDRLGRRAYFDGIVALDIGSMMLFDLLRDSRWYVVRNAAALLGEVHAAHADLALLPLLTHADERIRVAVARALLRLRTPKALQSLHPRVDDSNGEVRRLAAAAHGLSMGTGGGMRPPAARLSAALERETDEDVALEMLAALGRLGSADAVQQLLRIALPLSPETSLDAQRAALLRVAALDALVRARGRSMASANSTLVQDVDGEVAAAASRLLASMQTPAR